MGYEVWIYFAKVWFNFKKKRFVCTFPTIFYFIFLYRNARYDLFEIYTWENSKEFRKEESLR